MSNRTTADIGPFAIVPLWLIESGVSSGAVSTFALMWAKWADKQGDCYPSQTTIGKILGVSDRTVRNYLDELSQVGALKVETRRNDSGAQTSNLYSLRAVQPPEMSFRGGGNELPGGVEMSFQGPRKSASDEPYPDEPDPEEPPSLPLSETTTISDDSDNQETEGIPSDEGAAPLVEASTPDPLPPQVEEAYGMLVDLYGEEVARRALFIRDFEEQLTVPATWGAPRGRYASADVLVAAVRLAHVFADEAQEVGFRRPNPLLHATLRDLRIDLTADRATPEKLERLIRWAFSEESWWRDKLKTYADFHSKIDKLRVQANEAHRKMKSQAPAPQGGEDWMARTNY